MPLRELRENLVAAAGRVSQLPIMCRVLRPNPHLPPRRTGFEDRRTLEGKGQAAADGTLILGEDQQRAIAEKIGPVALGQQIAHIE
jgi:hypothetical protein